MSTYEKASWVLFRLYRMRNMDFASITVEDILDKASPREIDFYYHHICEVRA